MTRLTLIAVVAWLLGQKLALAENKSGTMESPPISDDCRVLRHLAQGADFLANSQRVHRVLGTTYSNVKAFPNPFPPRSKAILASRIELKGWFFPHDVELANSGKTAVIRPPSDQRNVYGGITYQEMPNSTGFIGPKMGKAEPHEIVIPRGILPYVNTITPAEGVFNNPTGYSSNLPVFRRNEKGKLEYVRTILESSPEHGFLFEDPRVSMLDDDLGNPVYLLSGTDYSRHVPGVTDKFIRNGFVELEFDAQGLPRVIPVDPQTKKPGFLYLSPPPVIGADGKHVGVDAKNAVVARRKKDNKVVVHTRYRPVFKNDPTYLHYKKYFAEKENKELLPWEYSEQSFVFDSYEDLKKYDWSHALEDLYVQQLGAPPLSTTPRIRPTEATIVSTERSVRESYDTEFLVPGKPQGFGPGARPLLVTRKGNLIYLQDKPRDKPRFAGLVPEGHQGRGKFVLDDGKTVYLTFDHKLRYMHFPGKEGEGPLAVKRVYSGTVKVWDETMSKVLLVYDETVRPTEAHHLGMSGVTDLHHASYTMGASLLGPRNARPNLLPLLEALERAAGKQVGEMTDADLAKAERRTDQNRSLLAELKRAGVSSEDLTNPEVAKKIKKDAAGTFIRTYGGASDAHTESFDYSPLDLLMELSPGSEVLARGQAYPLPPVELLRPLPAKDVSKP